MRRCKRRQSKLLEGESGPQATQSIGPWEAEVFHWREPAKASSSGGDTDEGPHPLGQAKRPTREGGPSRRARALLRSAASPRSGSALVTDGKRIVPRARGPRPSATQPSGPKHPHKAGMELSLGKTRFPGLLFSLAN